MYLKTALYITISFILLGCSKSTRTANKYPIPDQINIKSIHFSNIHLRIESQGQLRTYRSSYTSFSDSVLFLAIQTNFKKEIASLIFDTNGLRIFDIPSKGGILIDNSALKKGLGYTPTPTLLFNLIAGTISQTFFLEKINSNFHFQQTFDSTDTENSKLSEISISNSEGKEIILAKYSWDLKIVKNYPKTVTLIIVFNEETYEFDFDLDQRSYKPELPQLPEYINTYPLTKFVLQ